jgi:hypothetical protein
MRAMVNRVLAACAAVLLISGTVGSHQPPSPQSGTFENSLWIAPYYVEYLSDSDARFAQQVAELRQRLGSGPHALVGFASGLALEFPKTDLNQPIRESQLAGTLENIDRMVRRADAAHIPLHISITSGLFHGHNELRRSAIEQDVRNAQWFSDGWIAEPSSIKSNTGDLPDEVWITPSRYAKPLRSRIEEGVRIVATRLATQMSEHPYTLLTISGDGEVEFNYERNISGGEHVVAGNFSTVADYSPFMIEEFRDWIEHSRFEGDRTPASDDNRDGHTFNEDFKTNFSTWRLRYYDSSGPVAYSTYSKLVAKLPASGPYFVAGGFDAPRVSMPGDAFWELWNQFRRLVISDYVHDFALWMTTSSARGKSFRIPASRFYSHQIPADYLFGDSNSLRLKTSASTLETAFIAPIGSSGVTVFNTFDGKVHKRTGTAALFEAISRSSESWGILEYNPSVPVGKASAASTDMSYFKGELNLLYSYRPHIIVPFAWSNLKEHQALNFQNSAFEAAISQFISEVGNRPWTPRPH